MMYGTGCRCGLGQEWDGMGMGQCDPTVQSCPPEVDITKLYPTTGGVTPEEYLAAWEGQRGAMIAGPAPTVHQTPKQCYDECKAMEAAGAHFLIRCEDGCGYTGAGLIPGVSDTTLLIGGAAAILLLILVTR